MAVELDDGAGWRRSHWCLGYNRERACGMSQREDSEEQNARHGGLGAKKPLPGARTESQL
ncbi:hypothetical protein FRUB_03482 [Fimbriiglobus ruber]|uniref:Uncharacterized protein n=1 Tax=Fimbriiglobus ruber TaxID=1908690 RepID=A0A225DS48_9BACT|nr:hypothetical protein FRUB_03482 [Fimbriiglobus ruber]